MQSDDACSPRWTCSTRAGPSPPERRRLRPPYDATPLLANERRADVASTVGGESRRHPPGRPRAPSGDREVNVTFCALAPLRDRGMPAALPSERRPLRLCTRDCVVPRAASSLPRASTRHYFQNRAGTVVRTPGAIPFPPRRARRRRKRCRHPAPRAMPRSITFGAKGAGVRRRETSAPPTPMRAWARTTVSLELLASESDRYALDETTRADVRSATAAERTWAREGASESARATRRRRPRPRWRARGCASGSTASTTTKNVHRVGAFTGDGRRAFCAVVHEKGRPRWGPARATAEEAAMDRREMRRAVKDGDLDVSSPLLASSTRRRMLADIREPLDATYDTKSDSLHEPCVGSTASPRASPRRHRNRGDPRGFGRRTGGDTIPVTSLSLAR